MYDQEFKLSSVIRQTRCVMASYLHNKDGSACIFTVNSIRYRNEGSNSN